MTTKTTCSACDALIAVLEGLFRECEMIHRHWGEGSNAKTANDAITAARNALKLAKGA